MAMAAREMTTAGDRAAARMKRLRSITGGGGIEVWRYFDDLWVDAVFMVSCGEPITIEVLNPEGDWVQIHAVQMSEEIAGREDDIAVAIQEREKIEVQRKVAAAFGLTLEALHLDERKPRP